MQCKLHAGIIEYSDTSSDGSSYTSDHRVLVFVHGLLADAELWTPVVDELKKGVRCIVPTWPLGCHRHPFSSSAALGPHGLAAIIAEFLNTLDLRNVVLVGSDSGGALCQLVAADHPERIGGVVLTNCDALEVFPPKRFSYLRWSAKIPGAYTVLAKLVWWLPILRKSPLAWGALSASFRDELYTRWSRAFAQNRGARRDAARFAKELDPEITLAAADRLADTTLPFLILWGASDRMFRLELAQRLAKKIGRATVVVVDDAKTFVTLDQPTICAEHVSSFIAEQAALAA